MEVQLVGDRKNTRVDQRILHLDVAAAALKLVRVLPCVGSPSGLDVDAFLVQQTVVLCRGNLGRICQTHSMFLRTALSPKCAHSTWNSCGFCTPPRGTLC